MFKKYREHPLHLASHLFHSQDNHHKSFPICPSRDILCIYKQIYANRSTHTFLLFLWVINSSASKEYKVIKLSSDLFKQCIS